MISLRLNGPVKEITKGTGYFSFRSAAGHGSEAMLPSPNLEAISLANPIFRTVVADSNIH
jgi:hypothetical protein